MLVDAKSLSKQPVFSVRCHVEWYVCPTIRLPSNELFCIFISMCCGARNPWKPCNPVRNLSTSDPWRRSNSGASGYQLNLRPKLIKVSFDCIYFVLHYIYIFFFICNVFSFISKIFNCFCKFYRLSCKALSFVNPKKERSLGIRCIRARAVFLKCTWKINVRVHPTRKIVNRLKIKFHNISYIFTIRTYCLDSMYIHFFSFEHITQHLLVLIKTKHLFVTQFLNSSFYFTFSVQ